VTVLPVLAFSFAALSQDGGKISWRKDVVRALKDAKEAGKPTMLYFTSDG